MCNASLSWTYAKVARIATKASIRNPSKTAIPVVLIVTSQTILRFRNVASTCGGKSSTTRTSTAFSFSIRFGVSIPSYVDEVPTNKGS